jgi:hypothetical protein
VINKRFKYFIFLLLGLFSFSTQAKLQFDISVIHKQGIDKNLVLTTELHSQEFQSGRGAIHLRMKDGIQVTLFSRFEKTEDIYGPNDRIRTEIGLFNKESVLLKKFEGEENILRLGERKVFIYEDQKGELVEIHLRPYLL